MALEFTIRRENELPATPEQVWDAVATGPGNLGWLYPMEIEPREGGVVSRGPSTVTVWDPPRRFACRHESEDSSSDLEYLIEAREDGGTVLHIVIHRVLSGSAGDDWAAKTDGADKHADFYHHTLGQYLRYFSGRPATFVQAQGPAAATEANAFTVLRRGLGLTDDIAEGDAVRLAPVGLDPLEAVVDYLNPHFIGLRTADGLYRFFGRNAWGIPVGLSHHLFAADVDQQQTEQAWRGWLDRVFA
ncbi:MAG: SRPBCC domain-containing protein [Pseudonocardiales bacterium]|nr:SRPBCC domain-containing protein [Pseudonocardiales bacterium]MBV9029228.1 SRPBCC domain-containing protein [Pseudonocardiales bacterium]MBW0009719.1 SRPBCC domain-containing protein [Pseudonocardiales bacterium]